MERKTHKILRKIPLFFLMLFSILRLSSYSEANDINQCARYDIQNQELHVPCLIVGYEWEHHWLTLHMTDTGVFELSSLGTYSDEISDFVVNEDKCAYLSVSSKRLELPCVAIGETMIWLDLEFSDDFSHCTIFDFDTIGSIEPDPEDGLCTPENLKKCTDRASCVEAKGFWRNEMCLEERPENEVFTSGFDLGKLVTISQSGDAPDIRFPVNQILVYTPDHVSSSSIKNAIHSMDDVRLIGQAPGAGFYQLEVEAETVQDLNRIKSELVELPEVMGAMVNLLFPQRTEIGRCPVDPDVSLLPRDDKKIYEQIDYFVALEILQGIRDNISFSPVTVGVFESGYFPSCGEFDDINITNFSPFLPDGTRAPLMIDPPMSDAVSVAIARHGNSIAGLIAADNDGSGINGLATSLIGDNLNLVMADALVSIEPEIIASNCIGAIENMIVEGGAEIINVSFGLSIHRDEAGQQFLDDAIRAFRRFMSRYPDVLFVIAAGNRRIQLTGSNEVPGGIVLPNTLTVSYWSHDDPAVLGNSAYGDVVEISAPGDNIPVPNINGRDHGTGTSLAAPIVVSAAAMLKSVGGRDLSASEIKSLLINHTFGERTEPQGGTQLSFSYPLMDLLWEKYQTTEWGEYFFDFDLDGLHDVPVNVAITVCDGVDMTLSEFGSFTIDPTIACLPGDGIMLMPSDGTSWYLGVYGINGREDVLALFFTGESPFALNTNYKLGEDATAVVTVIDGDLIDRSQCKHLDPNDGDFSYRGTIESGILSFIECNITERDHNGEPKYLAVKIHFKGNVDGYISTYYPSNEIIPIDIDPLPTYINGKLTSIMVATPEPLGFYGEFVEQTCIQDEEDNL